MSKRDHCALASCRRPIETKAAGAYAIRFEILGQGSSIKAIVCSRVCLETLLKELLG